MRVKVNGREVYLWCTAEEVAQTVGVPGEVRAKLMWLIEADKAAEAGGE